MALLRVCTAADARAVGHGVRGSPAPGGGDGTTINNPDGNGNGGGNGGGDNGGGDNGGGHNGGDKSAFTVHTTLDLGQPFAEDPYYDDELGDVAVHVRADRTGEPAQIPIPFQLINTGQADLEDLVFTIGFTVIPSPNPDAPPVPTPDDPPLELSPQTTAGTCTAEDTTSSATSMVCELGTLAAGTDATVTVTSPQWFNLSVQMELTARGP